MIKLENVTTSGGDGSIVNDIADEKVALEKIKSIENSGNVAYFWCKKSNRLIKKDPE